MLRIDTEGYSALHVMAHNGHVVVGLSDNSVAVVDLAREVHIPQTWLGFRLGFSLGFRLGLTSPARFIYPKPG